MKKVVIADHHPLTRHGIVQLLQSDTRYKVVGEVSQGSDLLPVLEKERPEILILELNLPEITGFHALRSIRDEFPKTKVVIFSSHPEGIYGLRSIKSGAKGYIPKTTSPEVFMLALHNIAAGEIFINDEVAEAGNAHKINDNSIEGRYRKLSTREIEVLNLLSSGKRNKDIAQLLEINEKTVSTYKTRLLKKLNVNSLAELINQSKMFQFN